MLIDILSLFPKYFRGPFDESIVMQARKKKLVEIRLTDIRDFSDNPNRRVDDRPYGGGPGMVMMPQPVMSAIRSVIKDRSHVIYLSPRGKPLTASKCRELAKMEHIILLCGHYEGIDQRVIDQAVDEEISIGDYVLSNGGLAAIVVTDCVVRLIPGVLGDELSAAEDSFERTWNENGTEHLLLDYQHYTRPEIFEGNRVPSILLSGDHEKIRKWRLEEARKKTCEVRPDL